MHIFDTDTSSTIRVTVMPPLRSETFRETLSGLQIRIWSQISVTQVVSVLTGSYQSYIKNFIIWVKNICIHSNTPTDYVNDYKIHNTPLTCGVRCLEY